MFSQKKEIQKLERLPEEFHVSGDHRLSEVHASGDSWDDFIAVNDPASGRKLPNEGHADGDSWDDFEVVNDPASGKKLPNEGHARNSYDHFGMHHCSSSANSDIFVTESFVKNISEIYGDFKPTDDEYPTMGITIQGAPIFVECVRFPSTAVVRRRANDEVLREHPAVGALWESKLIQYKGKCRTSTVHIHPMDYPFLSPRDINNFDTLRIHPDDPSTFDREHPYPVILINLQDEDLQILGFWVMDGEARPAPIQVVQDLSPQAQEAWNNAKPMPFFSQEAGITRRIDRLISKDWNVEYGINPITGEKAIKAERIDGKRVLIHFNVTQWE